MIPNSAPMAAVYLRPAATGSRDGKLFSRPVVAWNTNGAPLVVGTGNRLVMTGPYDGIEFLGLWQHAWSPSQDEMASLLPDRTPGSPDPLAVPVTIQQSDDGWWRAHRCSDDRQVTAGRSFEEVEQQLSVLGTFLVKRIVLLHDS